MNKKLLFSLSKKNGDFEVKFVRSSGPGGQNVNKNSTCAVVRHVATGIVVKCSTYKSREQNKKAAFKRLVEGEEFQQWLKQEISKRGVALQETSNMGPTGNRGAKVRTYNLVREEVIDHRSGHVSHDANDVLDGNLDKIIESVRLSSAKKDFDFPYEDND